MTRFHFSLSRLQKNQDQKQRLAEIEAMQRRASLNEAILQLKELQVHYDETAMSMNPKTASNVHLLMAHRDRLQQLDSELESTRQLITQLEAAWREADAKRQMESIKAEGYEVLREKEQAEHEEKQLKAEFNNLLDTFMRNNPTGEPVRD